MHRQDRHEQPTGDTTRCSRLVLVLWRGYHPAVAHNRSPSEIRSDVLGSPIEIFRGWHLEVECGGSDCPVGRMNGVDALIHHYPGAMVGEVLARLKCVACGRRLTTAVLSQSRPLRRLPLRGPEVSY